MQYISKPVSFHLENILYQSTFTVYIPCLFLFQDRKKLLHYGSSMNYILKVGGFYLDLFNNIKLRKNSFGQPLDLPFGWMDAHGLSRILCVVEYLRSRAWLSIASKPTISDRVGSLDGSCHSHSSSKSKEISKRNSVAFVIVGSVERGEG